MVSVRHIIREGDVALVVISIRSFVGRDESELEVLLGVRVAQSSLMPETLETQMVQLEREAGMTESGKLFLCLVPCGMGPAPRGVGLTLRAVVVTVVTLLQFEGLFGLVLQLEGGDLCERSQDIRIHTYNACMLQITCMYDE